MESNGVPAAGAPWESYITDPAEYPDPKDWKTEVCWPFRSPVRSLHEGHSWTALASRDSL